MPDRDDAFTSRNGLLSPQPHDFRSGSPPKTPMPGLTIDASCSRRPDWAMESSPEDYFQRPASVLSNASDFSDDSFCSGSRRSRPSEDGSCTSPESDIDDPFTFQFPSLSKGKGRASRLDDSPQFMPLNYGLRSKTRKDAAWSKAQSDHLWSTYLLYLHDPTVTPFRLGASRIPPEGVCHRVARETKRSWKGPKLANPAIRRSAKLSSQVHFPSRASEKSGSNTPTAEASRVYAQWPHSSSTTRNQLRELCKVKNATPAQRHRHLQSRSPTPFTKSKSYEPSRLHTPESRPSSFNTKDIALSLATSTSESMHPNGLLANLARETDTSIPALSITSPSEPDPSSLGGSLAINIEEANRRRKLGSPFMAPRTYGPSSSQLLRGRPSPPRMRSDTTGILRSPVHFDHPRSLNATQKRRAQHSLEEELSPNGAVLRPSILDEQLFGTPFSHSRRVRSRGFSLGDEALRHRAPGIFQRPPPQIDLPTQAEIVINKGASRTSAPKLLPSVFDGPQLGSPFCESGPSQTFPRRLFQDSQATIKRSTFATMHQTRHSIESFDFGAGPSLRSRLEQLDSKLQEIREREATSKAASKE